MNDNERIARLETKVDHIESDIHEIKSDVRELRRDIKDTNSKIDKSLTYLLSAFGTQFILLLGVMAHGFHWI